MNDPKRTSKRVLKFTNGGLGDYWRKITAKIPRAIIPPTIIKVIRSALLYGAVVSIGVVISSLRLSFWSFLSDLTANNYRARFNAPAPELSKAVGVAVSQSPFWHIASFAALLNWPLTDHSGPWPTIRPGDDLPIDAMHRVQDRLAHLVGVLSRSSSTTSAISCSVAPACAGADSSGDPVFGSGSPLSAHSGQINCASWWNLSNIPVSSYSVSTL